MKSPARFLTIYIHVMYDGPDVMLFIHISSFTTTDQNNVHVRLVHLKTRTKEGFDVL